MTSSTEAPAAERLNDSGITAGIQSKYFLDSHIKGRRIDVVSHQGVVTLRGEVASEDERAQALILARTTEGVQRVEDSLTVNLAAQSAPAQTQYAALISDLESKCAADRQIKGAAIDVMAKDGVVLLEGIVPTAAAKQRMRSLARQTKGAIHVIDRVKVGRGR